MKMQPFVMVPSPQAPAWGLGRGRTSSTYFRGTIPGLRVLRCVRRKHEDAAVCDGSQPPGSCLGLRSWANFFNGFPGHDTVA